MSTLKFRMINPYPSKPLKGEVCAQDCPFRGLEGQVEMQQIIIDFAPVILTILKY